MPLRALIFDSFFDSFRGVVALIRVFEGELKKGDALRFLGTDAEIDATEVGWLLPKPAPQPSLKTGEIGFLVTGLKDIRKVRVGDTVTRAGEEVAPLPGFKKVRPAVFASLFPADSSDFENLRDALEKLALSDAALSFEPENSTALGFGFRAGFLGLLHLEIVQERLEREFNLDLIATAPSVEFEIEKTDGTSFRATSPAKFPVANEIERVREPVVRLEIIAPAGDLGAIFELLNEKHGSAEGVEYLDQTRILIRQRVPLMGVITDFHDRLKSLSRGFASASWEPLGFEEAPLVKMDVLVAGDPVDALAVVVRKEEARRVGLALVKKLKETIPRAQFQIAIQAALGGTILARENIAPFRKDVTAKLYGGDRTRRMKLLEKQKKGKKRMKSVGKVDLPQEAFLATLG